MHLESEMGYDEDSVRIGEQPMSILRTEKPKGTRSKKVVAMADRLIYQVPEDRP